MVFYKFLGTKSNYYIIVTFCTPKLVKNQKNFAAQNFLGTKSNVYMVVTFCTWTNFSLSKFSCTKSNVYIVVTFCTQKLVIFKNFVFLQESGYKKHRYILSAPGEARALIHLAFSWMYSGTVGCVGLYSDVSKVGNVKKPGRHFDKRDKISAWLNF